MIAGLAPAGVEYTTAMTEKELWMMLNKVKGVNLGNWLVLEKWMSPALFEGTTAEDEYYLARQLPPGVYEARIRTHRSEYITERDFACIARMGFNSVRIPVPYFVFGDRPPFIGCVEELDRAFGWAEKYGIRILLDLHTVPMSQNGFDNGGLSGVCRWSQLPDEVAYVLQVLEKLARRYGHHAALMGIEPLNEPVSEEIWQTMDVQHRYTPVDQELARGSAPVTLAFLKDFYRKVYERIRPCMAQEKYLVFHDGFRLEAWEDFFRNSKMENVALDTHKYLMTAEAMGCDCSLQGYLNHIQSVWLPEISRVQRYVTVICGEWSLFNSYTVGMDTKGGQTVLNGMAFDGKRQQLSPEEKKQVYQALAKAQLALWNRAGGYYYWSYKVLLDTVHSPDWFGWDSWDLGKACMEGWFPENKG